MFINKIIINNYRATEHAEYSIDPTKTVIVGKNNVGKTSLFEFLRLALTNEGSLEFDDYPIFLRNELYSLILLYAKSEIDYFKFVKEVKLPSIEISIDYSADPDSSDLEVLQSAIIDLDEDVNYALIEVSAIVCTEEKLKEAIKPLADVLSENSGKAKIDLSKKEISDNGLDKAKELIRNKFKTLFTLKSFSKNPNTCAKRILDVKPSEIINARFIDAQRPIESSEGSIFNKVLKRFLKSGTKGVVPSLEKLNDEIYKQKDKFKTAFNELLFNVLQEFYLTEYPKDSKETGVDVSLEIDLEKVILEGASIYYKDSNKTESLPQKYNGLGYKNLLLMELEIASFAFEAKEKNPNAPCLLFIEEPESHMHPQLQERFVEFIDEFAKKMSGADQTRPCPIIFSTHSPHIANVVDFSKIRYVIRNEEKTICKDMNDFASDYNTSEEKKTHIDFLKKYLELTRCDLFFADKVILVEGATERIYVPYCMNVLNKTIKEFNLNRQYYTLIEVGGAHGYLFIPFLRFLKTPSLIITDIDPINEKREGCDVSAGVDTSNSTIKHWLNDEIQYMQTSFEDILKLPDNKKVKDGISICYQIEENGLVGKTLEPAIMIANKNDFKIASESDIKSVNKLNFILEIISNNKSSHNVPIYIKNGLTWLNGE